MKYIKQISFCMVIAIFATGILTWNIFLNLETKSTVSVLSHSAIRFHILANSDSVSDQALKMRVKESVVNYIYEKTGDFKTVDEAKNFILNNDKTIKSIATKAIADNGYDYTVSSTFGFSDFPVKTYGDVIFPKGTYTSYTIKIGNGKGHNWWCVLYPPLCFVDSTYAVVPDSSKEVLRQSLDAADYQALLIRQPEVHVRIRSKFLDLLKKDSSVTEGREQPDR